MKSLFVICLLACSTNTFASDYELNNKCVQVVEKYKFIPEAITLVPLKSGEVVTMLEGAKSEKVLTVWRGYESPTSPRMYPQFTLSTNGCSGNTNQSGKAADYVSTGVATYIQSKEAKKEVEAEIHKACDLAPAFKEAVAHVFKYKYKDIENSQKAQ
jgi:hypothetical protein